MVTLAWIWGKPKIEKYPVKFYCQVAKLQGLSTLECC
jgi:hypothetical protein